MVSSLKIRLKWLVLGLVLTGLTGSCKEIYVRNPFSTTPPVVVHPIQDVDLFYIPRTAVVEWDDIDLHQFMTDDQISTMRDSGLYSITPEGILLGDLIRVEKDGWFCSDYFKDEIMRARIE